MSLRIVRRTSAVVALAFCAGVLTTESGARAAGFEKVTTWSGKHAGVAGAAVSTVKGAEAVYFNPAGLAGAMSSEASLNFSPTFGQYTGPITAPGQQLESSRKLAPAFGVLGSYRLGPSLGVGAGVFASGGTKALFEGVDFSSVNPSFDTLKPDFQSDLTVTEFSLGFGMAPIEGLRIGAAWRIVRVDATLATVSSPVTTLLTSVKLSDMDDMRFNGFRLGAQYLGVDENWGVGFNWRTAIDFTAEGTSSSRSEVGAGPLAAVDNTGGEASISSTFPSQISLGGYVDPIESVRLMGEYVWTEYGAVDRLTPSGTLTLNPALGGATVSIPVIQTGWENQTNLKLGVECTALEDWAFRAGYAYTSQVTPKALARATFASPGAANTVTLGAGTSLFEKAIEVNGAGEYSFASGTITDEQPLIGKYSTDVFVFHLGATYRL
ncbi:MAG: outer membrane protein transport protein [Oligoflexia bacterium]|nr:outer membrane protein transport protein [Oligoflexia bacterium]